MEPETWYDTAWCRYKVVNSLQSHHNGYPVVRPWGMVWGVFVCLNFDLCFASFPSVSYLIACYIGPCYNNRPSVTALTGQQELLINGTVKFPFVLKTFRHEHMMFAISRI